MHTQAAATALPCGVSLPASSNPHLEYSNAAHQEYEEQMDAAEVAIMKANFAAEINGGKPDNTLEPDVPVPEGLPYSLHPVPFGLLCKELADEVSTFVTLDYQAIHLLQIAAERFMETVYKAGLEGGDDVDTVVRDGIAAMCAHNGPGCVCCAPKNSRPTKRPRTKQHI